MKHPKGLVSRNGIWYITIMFNGRRIRISTKTNDLPLAKKIYDKVRGEVVSGNFGLIFLNGPD
jgi:hypothetical protein